MQYIVALGNPGDEYADTRHNVGWLVADECIQAWGLPPLIASRSLGGSLTEGVVIGCEVKILYPDTFMNNSGSAVVKLIRKEESTRLIVLHDDVDLPFGDVKVNRGRGAGGNQGVASIINKLGTNDFVRVRIGIAPKNVLTGMVKRPIGGGPLERFVLQPFTEDEKRQLPAICEKARLAIELILHDGLARAMNEINARVGS